MIMVKLIGGLGNQMFQYAVARNLAEKRQATLKLDILEFETYKLHKYSLGHFNIRESLASAEEVAFLTSQPGGVVKRIIGRLPRLPKRLPSTYYREKKDFHFEPAILSLPDGIYLDGHWQSEKYFSDIRSIILKEFTVKHPQRGRDEQLAALIESCDSVSIHIRRGDYISDPKTNKLIGTCSLNYYHCCVERLTQTVKTPHFFIFSDDPQWAHDNLKLSPATIVDHNDAETNYEDIRLMSQCKHHIIANSSFSWWGAWLNPRKDKLIFAPKRWFADDGFDTKDVIPGGWIRM
jgi:hypothetical protein